MPQRKEMNVNPVDGAEALFGRELDGRDDVLPGHALSPLQITDPGVISTSGTAHHTIARQTGDPLNEVAGIVFRITAADAYEVSKL
jgi:hypothetical protein